MKNMVAGLWEGSRMAIVVSVHSAAAPNDNEWNAYVQLIEDAIRRFGFDAVRALVITDGGGPNARHRATLNTATGQRSQRVAVVVDNAITRGIVTAISWFNRNIEPFGSRDLGDALRYLGVPAVEQAGLCKLLVELAKQMPASSIPHQLILPNVR